MAKAPMAIRSTVTKSRFLLDTAGAGEMQPTRRMHSESTQSVNPSLSLSMPSKQASSPDEVSFGAGVRVGVAVGVVVGVEVGVWVEVGVAVGVGATQLPSMQRSGALH
jgi:hypothetical protein